MASSSDAAVTVPLKNYDVFISFRGEDTRPNFTSHLFAALCRSYVRTYIDDRVGKGDKVWAELVKAIKGSTLFLVVFSENYASSTWCLNELVEIMECKKNGQVVIPVFYHIDPSHVRKQTGSHCTALAEHKKHGKEKMQKWKDALCDAANLSGFHSITCKREMETGDVSKSIQCYMNETGASEAESREHLSCMICNTWKKMNEEALSSTFPESFVYIAINLARTCLFFYQHGDGHTIQDQETKSRIQSLIMQPISVISK